MLWIDMLKSVYREIIFENCNDICLIIVPHVKLLFIYKPRKLN